MDSSLLSPDFKLQLKKQRDHLITKRDAIIQDAIDDATQTIDANISDINNLLSKATNTPKAKTTATRGRPKKENVEVEAKTTATRGRPKKETIEAVAPPTQSKARKSKSKPPTKTKQKVAPSTDTLGLKAEFQDLKLAQAIPLVFQKDAGRIFSIDNVITALYDTVDPEIHAKTRQRIGVSLGHSAGREEIVKVQVHPAMYRLNN
jgi:AT hook motif